MEVDPRGLEILDAAACAMNPSARKNLAPQTLEALDQFSIRLRKAMDCFEDQHQPLWRRTRRGILCFQGLGLTHLPPALRIDIKRRFGHINTILSVYPIGAEEDYAHVSENHLLKIQRIILGFVSDAP